MELILWTARKYQQTRDPAYQRLQVVKAHNSSFIYTFFPHFTTIDCNLLNVDKLDITAQKCGKGFSVFQ